MPLSENTDFPLLEDLAGAAQKGDKDAYRRFLEALVPYVRAVVNCRVDAVADVDDIVQDCLLGIHTSLHTYAPSRRIKPWINAIIRYKVIDYFRSMSRKKEHTTGADLGVTTPASEPNLEREALTPDARRVWRQVEQLPEGMKEAILLTKRQGMSTRNAASHMGLSEAALRQRISRAYKKLAVLCEKMWRSEEDE
jgi:RNA polymerase sigma-70 factor (ECF subfamily)